MEDIHTNVGKAEQREEGTSRRGGGGAENRQGNSSFWERVERILR